MVCDLHYHAHKGLSASETKEYFLKLKELNGVEKINIASIPVVNGGSTYRLQNLRLLMLKNMLFPYAFSFMGLVHGTDEDYLTQLKKGFAMGFEGLKILETKPDVQKDFGIRLTSCEFEPMFSFLEEKGIPVLMHVGDPKDSWDIEKVDKWALEHGRFYGLPGFLSLDELYSDVEQILERHPKLRLILAHFYFMSKQLSKAEELFEKYPNVCFDLTPGKEMYKNFSANTKKTREFFIKYADRLYFGTDVHDELVPKYHSDLYALVGKMLCESEPYECRNITYNPLSLPIDVCEKIKSGNFVKLLGRQPKSLNIELIRAEIERLSKEENLSEHDKRELLIVKEYFK